MKKYILLIMMCVSLQSFAFGLSGLGNMNFEKSPSTKQTDKESNKSKKEKLLKEKAEHSRKLASKN
ncbi:MAG: hypothetical protein CME62_06925 [Halobacteriovoraceae bacterium]|nr:hypothetical protein [Halobacteriovoraceae bacterium]|tara:strand:- start:20224 stop:20421 length:198 start_codon:yes stop_codon:yes gene_type:complete